MFSTCYRRRRSLINGILLERPSRYSGASLPWSISRITKRLAHIRLDRQLSFRNTSTNQLSTFLHTPRTRRHPLGMERLPLCRSQRRCGKKRFNGAPHLGQSRCLKSRFGQKTRPLLLFRLIRGEFLQQRDGRSRRERGFSAVERIADRIGERVAIEFELPRSSSQHPSSGDAAHRSRPKTAVRPSTRTGRDAWIYSADKAAAQGRTQPARAETVHRARRRCWQAAGAPMREDS